MIGKIYVKDVLKKSFETGMPIQVACLDTSRMLQRMAKNQLGIVIPEPIIMK